MKMNNQGMSLVGALVAIAIMSLAITVMTKSTVLFMKTSKTLTINNDKESIKHMVLSSIDCKTTFSTVCTPGEEINVARVNKTNILAPATYGEFQLKAFCNDSGLGAIFRTTRIKDGKLLKHPLLKTVITWTDPKSLLFLEGVDMCGGNDLKCIVGTGNFYGHFKNGKCVAK